MSERKPELWDVEEEFTERLYDDRDEAIHDYLAENFEEPGNDGVYRLVDAPETLTVTGYVHQTVDVDDTVRLHGPLERLLEQLDEEYAGPDCELTEPTEAMKAAERAFVAAVVAEYKPWAADQVSTETVNVREWCREHAPEWIGETQ